MTFSLPPNTPKGQAEAISADDKNITVTAGAGTGKTWVLTERYVRLLLKDNVTLPADILTLTYTEAAAEEMKARITRRITEVLENYPDQERKRAILDGLSDLWISTIHSFAARLIRESGLSLDIDPRAAVISTQQEEAFWEDIRTAAEFAKLGELAQTYGNRQLRKIAEELDNDANLSAAVAKWNAGKLADFAKKAAELHASSGRTWQEMLGWAEKDDILESGKQQVKALLVKEWRAVWDFWINAPVKAPKDRNTAGGRLYDFLAWQKTASPDDEETLRHFYTQIMTSEEFSGARNVTPAIKMSLSVWIGTRSKEILDATLTLDDNLIEQELSMRKTLLKFCGLCWGIWDIMKNKRGLLSFSDMITHASTAIMENGINRTFRYILIDEFQDTDRIQFNMINALNGETAKLFAVGDPKQSIYRFRHADPTLFAQTIENSDKKIELDTSFRTRETLLEIINNLFGSIWRNGLGKSEAMNGLKYDRLHPVDPKHGRSSGTIPEFEAIIAYDSKSTLTQARKNLAENLARKIYEWVDKSVTIWDKKQEETRSVKFSDFAVLTPARSIFPVLEDALARFGIKSIRDKSGDFFGRGEINDVVCLLRAAADMNDDFAVSGWLMSPFSGVNEEDVLACLTRTDKDTRPIRLIHDKFPEAYSRLEHYALVGEVEGPAGLLAIFDRNRSWLSCYKPDDRMRVLRNVRLAVSIARDFQQSGTSGLKSCAEWLTRAVRDEVAYEEPAWHDENENAVRLGSVHAAKGLEYPVTIVFDQRNKKRSDRDALRPSRELGLAFTNLPDESKAPEGFTPKLAAWEKMLSEQGEDEEQARLFYVACTRAQDSLIFCGLVDEKKKEPHNHTWTKLLFGNSSNIDEKAANEIPDFVFPKNTAKKQDEALRPVNTVKICTPLRQISASSFSMFEWCPFAWRRIYRQGRTLRWEDPYEKAEDYEGRPGGAELGSLAHWILSRWMKEGGHIERLDYWLYNKEVLSKLPGYLRPEWRKDKDKAVLRKWLTDFAAGDLGAMLRTQNFESEKSFRIPLNGKTIMAGSIDALCGGKIIDYKITSSDRTPPGLYEAQLDFYAFVWHEMTGADNVETVIAFLREGRTESRTVTDFEGIRSRIERAAEICGSGPYTPRLEHCALCPFRKGCVNNNAGV